MPKPHANESKKDFLARCMGDDEARQTFPKQKQRYAFCNSAWSHNTTRDLQFIASASTLKGASGRIEEFQGREYYVVPAVLVQSQVLHNNLGATFLPPDEISEVWAESWNGVPVVLHEHPTMRGQAVSARSPEVLDHQGVGFVFRARAVKNGGLAQLKAEVWLDMARAQELKELSAILGQLQNGETVELSTGFASQLEEQTGSVGDDTYDMVLHPIGADHLAIFLDSVGACSLHDGCGLGVQQMTKTADTSAGTTGGTIPDPTTPAEQNSLLVSIKEMLVGLTNTLKKNEPPPPPKVIDADVVRNQIRLLKLARWTTCEIAAQLGVAEPLIRQLERGSAEPESTVAEGLATLFQSPITVNTDGMSDDERRMLLSNALQGSFGGAGKYVWIEAIYSSDNSLVFGVSMDSLNGREESCYMVDYAIDKDGKATWTEPKKVRRRVVYEAANNTTSGGNMAENTKDKATAGATGSDAAAPAGSPAPVANTEVADLTARLKVAEERAANAESKAKSLEETVAPLIAERERERQALIESLAANQTVFNKAELEAKPTAELQKLAQLSGAPHFGARGGPHVANAAPGTDEQFMEPVPYWKKEQAANGTEPEKK